VPLIAPLTPLPIAGIPRSDLVSPGSFDLNRSGPGTGWARLERASRTRSSLGMWRENVGIYDEPIDLSEARICSAIWWRSSGVGLDSQ
jgi:hypothetical protein